MVLPTVSWSRDEYAALGVPFGERGRILDEQLEVLARAYGPFPISHQGPRFPFEDVWLEPGAFTTAGPTMWFGGQGMHLALARRIARYGQGLNPFGPLTADDLGLLAEVMREHGRGVEELELVGGIRGTFHGVEDLADLDVAMADVPEQLEQGFTSFCFKPAMFVDEVAQVGELCRDLVRRFDQAVATARTP